MKQLRKGKSGEGEKWINLTGLFPGLRDGKTCQVYTSAKKY